MSKIVKRAAGALKADKHGILGSPIYDVDYEAIVRAVLSSVREPTKAMRDAAQCRPDAYEDGTRFYESIWRAMIDAAIGN